MKPSDVVGLDLIAIRCNVSVSAVHKWRDRYTDFPQPNHLGTATGNGSAPWWDWTEVVVWLDQHPKLGNRV